MPIYRVLVDHEENIWHVAEAFDGEDCYLRFDGGAESRCAFEYPRDWADVSTDALGQLFAGSERTSRRLR